MVCEGIGRRRVHYEQKVGKLRTAAQDAKAGLGSKAVDPGLPTNSPGGSSSSAGLLPKRSYSGLKTMQVDLKLGRLWRNEEKLSRIVAKHAEAEAAAARAMQHSLTVGRRRLREAVEEVLRKSIDVLLPGVASVIEAAAEAAPSPASGSPGGRRQGMALNDGVEDNEHEERTTPMDRGEAASPSEPERAPRVGDNVTVIGLAKTPQYNGMEGRVHSIRDDGRLEVALQMLREAGPDGGAGYPFAGLAQNQSKLLALRRENCRLHPSGPGVAPDLSGASAEFLSKGGHLLGLDDPSAWPRDVEDESLADSSDGG